jgi:RNA polymerase sigma-70 factor (ECF subfamily)
VAGPGDNPNWAIIADLYTALLRLDDSPVLAVNRAVAIGRAHGPEAGLAALQPVLADPRCARYVPLHAAYADLLERAGDPTAPETWERAVALADNEPQQAELRRRLDRCRSAPPQPPSERR